MIPALDTGSDIPAATELGDLAAARAIMTALAKATNVAAALDVWLSPAQKAEQLAFVTLVTSKLDVATHYTTWLEARGFREFRKVRWRVCVCVGGQSGAFLGSEAEGVLRCAERPYKGLLVVCGTACTHNTTQPATHTLAHTQPVTMPIASYPPRLFLHCTPPTTNIQQAAYGSQLPFPLSYIVPWSQRSEMRRLLGHVDGFKVITMCVS